MPCHFIVLSQIHWFSIFNSFMMVIFLTGIVTLILMRTLRKDYAKYAREAGELDDLDQELDESGWKQVILRNVFKMCRYSCLTGTLKCTLLGAWRRIPASSTTWIILCIGWHGVAAGNDGVCHDFVRDYYSWTCPTLRYGMFTFPILPIVGLRQPRPCTWVGERS